MKTLDEISGMIEEARVVLKNIPDGHMGADVTHARVRNILSIAEQEIKFHELDKADIASQKLVEIVNTLGTTAEILKDASTKAEQTALVQEKNTKAMIIWTVIMAIATGIIAISTVCSTITSYGQWNILSKQLESERGVVSTTNFIVKPIQVGKPFEIDLLGVNVGKTFAFDAKPRAFVDVYSGPFNIDEFENIIKMQKPSGADISPGSSLEITPKTNCNLTEQQVSSIKSGESHVSIVGDISYHDIFGQSHLTQFCETFDSSSNSLILCGENNTFN